MKAFRFSLEKVLAWRRTQLELEQVRHRQRLAEVAALDRARAELEAAGIQAEVQVRALPIVSGSDLAALGEFRRAVRARENQIAPRRAQAAQAAETQLLHVLEAQRRVRLLEKLRDRKLVEWKAEETRELEALASESALARRQDKDWRTAP